MSCAKECAPFGCPASKEEVRRTQRLADILAPSGVGVGDGKKGEIMTAVMGGVHLYVHRTVRTLSLVELEVVEIVTSVVQHTEVDQRGCPLSARRQQ